MAKSTPKKITQNSSKGTITTIIQLFPLFFFSFQANGDSSQGKYGGGVVGAAGAGSLFVANHAY